MTEVTLQLEPSAVLFYRRVADAAGLPLETVLADALFRLAGQLSLQSLQAQVRKEQQVP